MAHTRFKRATTAQWYLIDSANQRVGRVAAQIAYLLMGKHRPDWSPHWSSQDYVVVINAEKVTVTGNKLADKLYRRHSGYPGGLKSVSMEAMMQKKPQYILEHAVKGMLPKNRLGREFCRKLSVYAGPHHPHQGQNPVPLKGPLNSVADLYSALQALPPQKSSSSAAPHRTEDKGRVR